VYLMFKNFICIGLFFIWQPFHGIHNVNTFLNWVVFFTFLFLFYCFLRFLNLIPSLASIWLCLCFFPLVTYRSSKLWVLIADWTSRTSTPPRPILIWDGGGTWNG
jgi:hypothetical protein